MREKKIDTGFMRTYMKAQGRKLGRIGICRMLFCVRSSVLFYEALFQDVGYF